MLKQAHITPNPQGGWDSTDTGNSRASKHFGCKKDAVQWGRDHSHKIGSELVVHSPDGRISHKDSHGNDPCPPRG